MKKSLQRGASVLEFALCVPVFFIAMMGTIEFGRAMFAANELNHLAREAVRYAAVRSAKSDTPAGADDVTSYIRSRSIGLVPSDIKVTSAWAPSSVPGGTVEVTLTYEFAPIFAFLPDTLKHLRGYARSTIFN